MPMDKTQAFQKHIFFFGQQEIKRKTKTNQNPKFNLAKWYYRWNFTADFM